MVLKYFDTVILFVQEMFIYTLLKLANSEKNYFQRFDGRLKYFFNVK